VTHLVLEVSMLAENKLAVYAYVVEEVSAAWWRCSVCDGVCMCVSATATTIKTIPTSTQRAPTVCHSRTRTRIVRAHS
jgi:hypothetical protein